MARIVRRVGGSAGPHAYGSAPRLRAVGDVGWPGRWLPSASVGWEVVVVERSW